MKLQKVDHDNGRTEVRDSLVATISAADPIPQNVREQFVEELKLATQDLE